jgi:hypothetical protein
MASNRRDLKSYVRYDGSGRIIPGSNVLRKNMPKVGKWKETQTYKCCNPTQLVLYFTPESYPIENPSVNLFCNSVFVDNESASTYTATDLESLIQILIDEPAINDLGAFSAQLDGSVQFIPTAATINTYCPTGNLTFTITQDI